MSGGVWMLVTAGLEHGEAVPVHVMLSEGVHGESVRHVEVPNAGTELVRSASHACGEAAKILYRERYLDRQILVRFTLHDVASIYGRSAELAFALALVGATVKIPLPPLAATGLIEADGAIRGVEGIEAKAAAALKVLPRGGRFIYPSSNDATLSQELRRQATEAGVALTPSHRLEDLLPSLGLAISKTWLDEPFRGLQPFEISHASIFFGRETEIEDLAALLARRPAVLVLGPSGAGKSSLVLAGLLPALLRRSSEGQRLRWALLRPRDIRPDASPERELEALRAALAASRGQGGEGDLHTSTNEILPKLDASGLLKRLRANGASQLLWIIDQLEELFESGLHPATIRAMADFLAEANRQGVKIVATLASSAKHILDDSQPLASIFGIEGVFVLEARHDAKFLQAVITGPAAAANLHFEKGLDAELITAASHGGPDVLPLLELLLTELFERRDQAMRELRWDDYRAVGGLEGVVSARAEAVFQGLGTAQKDAVAQMIWRLATSGAIEAQDYDPPHAIHAVLAAFQARRLLVRVASTGGARLRAAHDALLRHWQRARSQLQDAQGDIELWRELHREARQWRAGNRAPMPSGPQLLASREFLARRSADFTQRDGELVAYIGASRRQHERRRLLAGLALGLPTAAAGVFGAIKLRDAYDASLRTTLNFDDAPVPAGAFKISAAPFLESKGLRVIRLSSEKSEVALLKFDRTGKSVAFFPKARPVEPESGSRPAPHGMLTQIAHEPVDDVSFSLRFADSLRAFRMLPVSRSVLLDVGLIQAAEWEMIPLDAAGRELDPADYRASRHPDTDENFWLSVTANQGKKLQGVKIVTYRHTAGRNDPSAHSAGEDFDGVHAVLIQKIQMLK